MLLERERQDKNTKVRAARQIKTKIENKIIELARKKKEIEQEYSAL